MNESLPIKRELTRIELRSAVRVGFFLGLMFGVLFGLYSAWVLQGAGIVGADLLSSSEAEQLKSIAGVSPVLLCLFMALTGALLYSILGGLCAVVYNLAAKWFGGIEYHTRADAPEKTSTQEDE